MSFAKTVREWKSGNYRADPGTPLRRPQALGPKCRQTFKIAVPSRRGLTSNPLAPSASTPAGRTHTTLHTSPQKVMRLF